MKIFAAILLLFILAACASPYQPVYVSSKGDYYIVERETVSTIYPGPTVALAGAGLYPWWSSAYFYGHPPSLFTYYSPYFYPHYFSVWSPLWQPNHYGWYGAYSPWCPPYRVRNHNTPVHLVGSNDTGGNMPVLPASVNTVVMPDTTPQMLRTVDPRDYWINPASRARADSSLANPGAGAGSATASRRRSTSISSLYPPSASAPARTSSVSSHSVSRSVSARSVTRAPAYSRTGERH